MKCGKCGGEMEILQEFALADYPVLSMFVSGELLEKAETIYIYKCRKCGRLEFYTKEQ